MRQQILALVAEIGLLCAGCTGVNAQGAVISGAVSGSTAIDSSSFNFGGNVSIWKTEVCSAAVISLGVCAKDIDR